MNLNWNNVHLDFLRRKCTTVLSKARDFVLGCRDNKDRSTSGKRDADLWTTKLFSALFGLQTSPQLNALELHVQKTTPKTRQNAVKTAPDVVVPGLPSFTPPNDRTTG